MKRSKAKMKQSSSVPLLMILAGTVLIVSILIWQVVTSAQSAASTATPVGEIPVDRISRVALEQAKTAFDTQAAVFVDVRSSGSFLNQHITGSVSIPLNELPSRLGELGKQDWIIPYCT